MVRIASATGVPWATSTSTWRSLATISSGLCLFLDMDPSSFGSEAILQGGPLQRGRINLGQLFTASPCGREVSREQGETACRVGEGGDISGHGLRDHAA